MDEALFGGSDDQEEVEIQFVGPPEYISSEEFKQFEKKHQLMINEKYGYMYIHFYKPFYFPGEIIRGSILMDLFNPLPKNVDELKLRFSGREMVGTHFAQVKESLKKQH